MCKHKDYAISIAKAADAKGFHFGAVVFRGRDIISVGWCQCKTHPKQARFMQYAKPYKRENSYLHAEIHALVGAKSEAKNCDMIIARIANDELKDSHPCEACSEAIRQSGIRRIWFWKEGNLTHKNV